jgi:butyryl-CoA dehydrogenase
VKPGEPGSVWPERALREEVQAFAGTARLADRAAALDREPRFPRDEFRAMGRAGWLGLTVPRDAGGRGLSVQEAACALYEFAYAAGTVFAKLSLQPEFCSLLLERGTPAQRDRHFRPLLRGDALIGNQITEPGAGSDLRAIAATAEPRPDGYRLTASKSEAAFAVDADAALVYARVSGGPGPAGLTAFLVPQDLPGISRGLRPDMGERWMRRGWVRYDRVSVAEEMRVGPEGTALEALKRELLRERLLLAAIYLGVARSAWERTVAHVGERRAFGGHLARQEAVSFPLVEDATRHDGASLYVLDTAARFDRGEDVAGSAAMAKWWAVAIALETIDHAIQFHGGAGYSAELPFERMYRDVRSGAIAHGSSELMHVVAARALWPRPEAGTAPAPPTAEP